MKTNLSNAGAAQVRPKWQWYYNRLQSLREMLLKDHANQVSGVGEPPEARGCDTVDTATDEYDQALTLGLLSKEDDTLFEVEAAIQRILDGTYGVCEATGNPIPEERLRIVPWTRFTKEALEKIERRASDMPPGRELIASDPRQVSPGAPILQRSQQ